ncbi:cell division protein FtsQ [Actinoplanes sp. NBRC 14428]|uniref:Cell division protein FtsQ n=1 Tax=Pseudosporangium ferrugineum TaxID=439699 RepID=A0A2T0S9H0_9ACTN|nr:FtsQ-type POTRA domain-containing protein [Pseudosporangium ferrugineum]PRY30075.1 cell division protein FtsQ [Pseudosporangium ferrugineum]BCJ51051.1 cell division protein FtsQ [Actinoplanes sp. NBRC 14428]
MSDGGGRNWRLVRADTDAVPPSVRRFMARARQRRMRAALPWAVGLGALLVVGALVWTVYGTSVLGVRDVRVVGTGILTPEQVEQAAAVRLTEPLARVDLDAIRGRVQALPAVERAVVSRSWPATVEVQVVERTAVAAVPLGQGFSLIDAEGVAFRTVPRRPAELPVAQLAAPGPADINTRSALVVLSSLTAELREQLVSISVPAPAQVRLGLRKDRTIIWGDDTESEKKAQVATALLERKGDTIDVSAPTVVTIR